MSLFRCGYCRKFHTSECIAEDVRSVREGIFMQDEDFKPMREDCFEFNEEKIEDKEDLIEIFAKTVLDSFTVKHFVKGDSSIGLYAWEDGRYVEAEEKLRAYVESLGLRIGLEKKVKTHIVNEVIEKVKRRSFYELREEPLRIAFRNYALSWRELLDGSLDEALIPIDETRENPIFHLIPWKLDVDGLRRCLDMLSSGRDFREIAEEYSPEAVNVFKSWVGESWILLFEIIGYCFYPDYPFNKAFMLVGDGSNGKSTYLRLVKEILGEWNVSGLSLQDLCLYRFASSELYHKLANIFQDIPSKPIGYTGYFKILTGEDYFSAPRKFRDSIYMKNYAKLLFSANELPEVSDMTEAFWRRWIVVEFPNKFPDNPNFFNEAFPREVIEKIIVLGIIAFRSVWHNRGFSVKGTAQDFREAWLRKTNSIYAYIKSGLEEGRIVLEKEAYTPASSLYEDYRIWVEDNDLEPEAKATFTKELERLFGITKKLIREGGRRIYVYHGVKLEEEREDREGLERWR